MVSQSLVNGVKPRTHPPDDVTRVATRSRPARARLSGLRGGGHRAALDALAAAMLDDPDRADEVVSTVLADAPSQLVTWDEPQVRQELARLVFQHCTGPTDTPPNDHADIEPDPLIVTARLRELSPRQRGAIALVMYGEHTHRQVADLLGMSTDAVSELVCGTAGSATETRPTQPSSRDAVPPTSVEPASADEQDEQTRRDLARLSVDELCAGWRACVRVAGQLSAGGPRARLAHLRALYLSEFRHRGSDGFARWMIAGGRGDPQTFLRREQKAGA